MNSIDQRNVVSLPDRESRLFRNNMLLDIHSQLFRSSVDMFLTALDAFLGVLEKNFDL